MADPASTADAAQAHGKTRCCGCYNMDEPLLSQTIPDRETCKSAKARPECDKCGCPRKDKDDKHCFGQGEGVQWNCKQQSCCCCSIFLFVYFVFFGLIQWCCFHFATWNCGSLDDHYEYPGGGKSNLGNASTNLLPEYSLIIASDPTWYGSDTFDLFESNENANPLEKVGTWFRTWGPWFYTYTYQSIADSKATVYMRRTILGMTGAVREAKAMRCDGKDPGGGSELKMSEGINVITNSIRELFQANTGSVFTMTVDDTEVGIVEETFSGTRSASFRSEGSHTNSFAALTSQPKQNGKPRWFMLNHGDKMPVPYWMTTGIAVIYAFKVDDLGDADDNNNNGNPSFLSAFDNMNTSTAEGHAAAKKSVKV